MKTYAYDRQKASEYAMTWALKRNPDYYDFDGIGGDCTNFISQCLFAGTNTMNYTKETGWYYVSLNNRAPAWSSVNFLNLFLNKNNGPGPFGEITTLDNIVIGDVIQLMTQEDYFHHSVMVTDKIDDELYVCAHTFDALNRPLFSYNIKEMRPIHIIGYRNWV